MEELEKLKYELLECCELYPQMIKKGLITVENANWGIQKIIDKIRKIKQSS
jgi:hypothetical protein